MTDENSTSDPLARSRGRLDQIELQAIKQFTDDFHDSGCQFPHGGACACGWNRVQARIEELGGANPERVAYLRGSVRDLNDEARERVEETLAQIEAALAVERPRPPRQDVTCDVSPIHTGEEGDGPLESTDLYVEGRGIGVLVNVTLDGEVTYSCIVDGLPKKHGTLADVTRPRRPLDACTCEIDRHDFHCPIHGPEMKPTFRGDGHE